MPGSFDPFTLGHFDVALRAAELFGEVVIAVMANGEKNGFFTPEERAEICRAAFKEAGVDSVKVIVNNGLLADLYNEVDACCMVKGVRNSNDFVYENELWLINRSFNSRVETVFLPSQSQYSHISSTMVREMLKYGVPLSSAMPKGAGEKAMEIYSSKI
jgi:pantetheine-phosphate adenylyltransferase